MTNRHENPVTEVRVDIWLWAARFFKTRSLCKQAIDGGKISVNDGSCKAAKLLHVGDRLSIVRGEDRMEVDVLALSDQRGPASVAQALYAETAASRIARETLKEQRRLTGAAFDHPHSRPDKHARRQLRQMKDHTEQ
jgi:ribosome-associated heat shock protein Hsp15